MVLVSIIIPIYNVEKYLPQCLDSVRAQSYENWEALLIDDGSNDGSSDICDRYAMHDTRFRVIHKENGGSASAKNIGLDNITGHYVTFIDSDDYVEPCWLERLIYTAQTFNADVVEYDFDKVFRTHSQSVNSYPEPVCVYTVRDYLAQYLGNWTSSLFWNKLIRSELINGIRFRKERRCIDDEFFTYKVISGAKTIARIRDVLYHYRQRASSAVASPKNKLQITEDSLEILIERYEWINSRFPELRNIYLNHDVEILFYYAGFVHSEVTVKKFRKISRYYLIETVRQKSEIKTLINAMRLLLISRNKLMMNENGNNVRPDYGVYFE